MARLEHYRRDEGGWRYSMQDAGGTVVLASGVTLDVDAIYEGAFEPPSD